MSNYTTGGTTTTYYIGGLLERVISSAGSDFRYQIPAGSSTIVVSRQSSGTNSFHYVTSDHLGSSSVITNSAGGILVNSSFDPFGKRRGSSWAGSPSAGDWTAIATTTRRGYTEHTMLDNLGLIHMNGRMQDPVIGRFASADPFVTDPTNTQSFNRYSYVLNRPLTFIDPSGFDPEADPCIGSGSLCTPNDITNYFIEIQGTRHPPCDFACQSQQYQARDDAAAYAFASSVQQQERLSQIVGQQTCTTADCIPTARIDPDNPEGLEVIEICGDCKRMTYRVGQAWDSFMSWSCLNCGWPGAGWDASLNGLGPEFAVIGAFRVEASAAKGAFEIAKAGGKHAGFLKSYIGRTPAEIKKGIASIEKLIADHRSWIANPRLKIPNFGLLDPRQQSALINSKWPADIARQQEQLDILRGILGGQ